MYVKHVGVCMYSMRVYGETHCLSKTALCSAPCSAATTSDFSLEQEQEEGRTAHQYYSIAHSESKGCEIDSPFEALQLCHEMLHLGRAVRPLLDGIRQLLLGQVEQLLLCCGNLPHLLDLLHRRVDLTL